MQLAEFEYRIVRRAEAESVIDWLNREGRSGWQLAWLNPDQTEAIMMRNKLEYTTIADKKEP